MNGNHKVLWWIIGTLSTLLLGLGSGTVATVYQHGERIAVLETQVADTKQQLERIDHKLDRLLELETQRNR